MITTRQGRFCLPVKAEYKSLMPGMVHDQSSTGSTVFIEPAAVVKLNNDIRELELKEQAEIEVILADLSAKAAEYTDSLLLDYEILTNLDCIFAKALLSRHFNCSRPVMNNKGIVNIKKGRHPLIEPHTVVPIDIYLGTDFNLLIITGPNTGGKTVSLKTVGLLTLMAQAGLNIPALEHSDIAVFDNIFADIGDEQSIEQSLSTFSSHMTNTVDILKKLIATVSFYSMRLVLVLTLQKVQPLQLLYLTAFTDVILQQWRQHITARLKCMHSQPMVLKMPAVNLMYSHSALLIGFLSEFLERVMHLPFPKSLDFLTI